MLFVFLIIDLYFLIAALIPQISNYTVELVIPTGIPTKKAMAEIKIHPVMAEAKTRKYSKWFNTAQTSLC